MFAVVVILVAINLSVLFALGMVAFVTVLDLSLFYPEVLRPGVFVLAITAGLTTAFVLADTRAGTQFYATTAQVIPVLFLALAVQIRGVVSDRAKPEELRRAPAVTAIALVLGEYESLRALSDGAAKADFGIVVGALVAAGVGLVFPVLLGDPDEP